MINLWRSNQRQRGQIAIMMAAGFAGLLGMTGIAVDLGFAYVHRREVQNAADAAALAGVTRLGQHYEYMAAQNVQTTGLTPPTDQDDAAIKTSVLCALAGALPPFTPLNAPTNTCTASALPENASVVVPAAGDGNNYADGINYAWYVPSETSTGCNPVQPPCAVLGPAVGSGATLTTMTPAPVGVRVLLKYSYPTFFTKIIGVSTINVQASARAMLRPTSDTKLLASNGPFIVCGGNGSGTYGAEDLGQTPGPSPDSHYASKVQLLVPNSNPPIVNSQYYGDTFLVHSGKLGQVGADCGESSQNYKGLADTSAGVSCTTLPCNMPILTGDAAGPTVSLVAGLPGCKGTNQNNCVMILPIANQENADGTMHIVAFAPFWMHTNDGGFQPTDNSNSGCSASNCNVGTLLKGGAMGDLTAGSGVITVSSGYVTSGSYTIQSQPE
jgi:Flp pilus assembly protein TadG